MNPVTTKTSLYAVIRNLENFDMSDAEGNTDVHTTGTADTLHPSVESAKAVLDGTGETPLELITVAASGAIWTVELCFDGAYIAKWEGWDR